MIALWVIAGFVVVGAASWPLCHWLCGRPSWQQRADHHPLILLLALGPLLCALGVLTTVAVCLTGDPWCIPVVAVPAALITAWGIVINRPESR